MMRVAGGSHRQTADLRVFESVTVVTTECGCRIKNFDGIDGQRLESGQPDSSAEQIIGVRGNGEAATLVNDIADLARRFSLQIGQFGADAEQMPVCGSHLDSGENEKIVDGQAVRSEEHTSELQSRE